MNTSRWHKPAVHAIRVAMLVGIALLLRDQYRAATLKGRSVEVELNLVRELFPMASKLTPEGDDRLAVSDGDGSVFGFVQQTAPLSDSIVGFSGSTNVLLGFAEDRILGWRVISSGDTRDHVRQVVTDDVFMSALGGLSVDDAKLPSIDAVSGATLTSLAILEAISLRLGGDRDHGSLRFPDDPSLEAVGQVFEDAAKFDVTSAPNVLTVYDAAGTTIGTILRTSPAADSTIGYQGPTDALIGFDAQGKVVGLAISKSYDNEPYVGYVRDDT